MATYVIGDVQGCFLSLEKLLDAIGFNKKDDKIIFLGDVINRGPRSLETLRFIKNHASSMEMVLGNHEIFAIALSEEATRATRQHTLHELLNAPDKIDLIDFLRDQPIIKKDGNNIFVHAGILPAISLEYAIKSAHEISNILKGNEAKNFLARFYEKTPTVLKPDMGRKKSLRLLLASFTMIRMCPKINEMNLSYSGDLAKAPRTMMPWFLLRNDGDINFYFGHWAALGLYQHERYYCLDSGCVWGQKLTALRLADQKIFQVDHCENG